MGVQVIFNDRKRTLRNIESNVPVKGELLLRALKVKDDELLLHRPDGLQLPLLVRGENTVRVNEESIFHTRVKAA